MSDHEDTTSTKREYEAAADEPGENAAEGGEKVTGQELGGDEAATAQQPKEEEASGQGDGDNPEGGDDANEAGAPEQVRIQTLILDLIFIFHNPSLKCCFDTHTHILCYCSNRHNFTGMLSVKSR